MKNVSEVSKQVLLDEEVVKRIKAKKGKWKDLYEILDRIGDARDGFSLYSKNNTIPVTNFFRRFKEECWLENENSRLKTLQNYKSKIWGIENEKELYVRIIRDYLSIIKIYLDSEIKGDETKLTLPKRKNHYRLRPLKERRAEQYPTKKINENSLRKIDHFIFEKSTLVEKIMQKDVEEWVEYVMLWNTYDGTKAEIKVMNILKESVPEIRWEWSSEEEDISGVDIKGFINGSKESLLLQIKGLKSAGRGSGEVDIENTIIVYYAAENGDVFLIPKKYGIEGWIAYFLRVFCKIKGIDFVEFIKRRKKI